MKKAIALLTLLFVVVGTVTSCGNVKFPVHFMVDGEIYGTVSTNGNEKLSLPKNPTKEGYIFDGWYWDEGTWERPFTANSLLNEPLSAEMKVYAKWRAEGEEPGGNDGGNTPGEGTEGGNETEPTVTDPTILVSSTKASKGASNVEITVAFRKNPGITSALIKIAFDDTALELVEMTYNTELGGTTVPNATTDSPVTAYWADNFKDVTTENITFVTLKFNISNNARKGEYEISVSYDADDLFNADEENVDFDVVNGKITVS